MIKCLLCNGEFEQITTNHLQSVHGIDFWAYVAMFPGAPTISEERRRILSEAATGKVFSEEHKRNLWKASRRYWDSPGAKKPASFTFAGRTHDDGAKWSISESMMGHPVSEETRRRISESQKELWKDPEYAKRVIESLNLRPSFSELQLQSVLDKYFPGEWKYTGDGTFWLEGKNPDFINVNGRKQVIEMFGIYWHDPNLFPNRPTEEELIAHYKKYGFACLVIWEYDIWGDVSSVVERVKTLNDSRTQI